MIEERFKRVRQRNWVVVLIDILDAAVQVEGELDRRYLDS